MNTARELSSPKASAEIFRRSIPSPKLLNPSESLNPCKKAAVISEGSLPLSPPKAPCQAHCTPTSPPLSCSRDVTSHFCIGKSFPSSAASGSMCRSSIEGFVSVSHVNSAMESLSFYSVVTAETSFSPPVGRACRRVSDLGTERSCGEQLSGDERPSTPRAPVKLNRHRSVKTFFPGRTRRKLDFDDL